MGGLLENTAAVIKQNDPDIPEYLDFDQLRREGLEHIGNLAGKIWTDHNAHDPGITILEVLVYALLDLGYKTNLPFKNLIAQKDNSEKDDNFLTPLEILTINPVSITDYRKLLIEIDGVRNAWLEIADQEVALFINQQINSLTCTSPIKPNEEEEISFEEAIHVIDNRRDCLLDKAYQQLCLNGLYKVFIEKEDDTVDEIALKEAVKSFLSEHRNLCEDFIQIEILKPIDFGVCLDVEIALGVDPKKVYSKIIKALRNYFQPEINYYTLNELLNKGKTIDAIFEGRPYLKESFGFIDTDELEKLEKRNEIHLSDLYAIVLEIEGVQKVKKAHINKGNIAGSLAWVHGLEKDEVPVFLLENSCIDLYSQQGIIKLDKLKAHQSLSFGKKFRLPLTSLNNEIPIGIYHDDLSEFYSIQNDFPVVYGVGEDGLAESATLLRKTQALQLKGYLLFYDQLLANYASQLANIRSLFSLKSEADSAEETCKTYFTQLPDSIPGIESLLKFHTTAETQNGSSVVAYPVQNNEAWKNAIALLEAHPRTEFSIGNYCDSQSGLVDLVSFESINIRSIHINQLVDVFFSKKYSIQVLEDRFGCFFVLYPNTSSQLLLVGTKRYKSINEAKSEAKNVAFMASTATGYNLVTDTLGTTTQHYFGIAFQPVSYLDVLQELTENKEEYIARRKLFLDHLLARFGEGFTEYTLLQYKGNLSETTLDQKRIEDQSSYIKEFADLSRNRGKAFDYLKPAWNTDNVSGFEKRVSLLSGINNYERRNLCNFEVSECHRFGLNDANGNLLFRSNRSYENKEELLLAANKVLVQLRDPKSYKKLEKTLNGFNRSVISRLFSAKASEENIITTKYDFHQQLINHKGEEVARSKSLTSEGSALKNQSDFIKKGKQQTVVNEYAVSKECRLLPLDREHCFLDVHTLDRDVEIKTLESWKWHILNPINREHKMSTVAFSSVNEAWDAVLNEGALDAYLTTHNSAYKWNLTIPESKLLFEGTDCYPDKNKATDAWRRAKVLGGDAKNYVVEKQGNQLALKNAKKKVIALALLPEKEIKTIIGESIEAFGKRNTKVRIEKVSDKIGFSIQLNEQDASLISYCVYSSKKEALLEMEKAFKLGGDKKNYLQSGDEGNPEYSFLLRDGLGSFLMVPPEHFEIAKNRNKALNEVARFIAKNESPVTVKKEPNKYNWSLFNNEGVVLQSTSEFTSRTRAKSDFDKVIAKEALNSCKELCKELLYDFKVVKIPTAFNFIYGNTDAENVFNPLFISSKTYKTTEDAEKSYADFVDKLPQLVLKETKKNIGGRDFALYDKATVVATQFIKNNMPDVVKVAVSNSEKASLKEAEQLKNYLSKAYVNSETPNKDFTISDMELDGQVSYEWRFLKKNMPLAIHPSLCFEKESALQIKRAICDYIPPVQLQKCPDKPIVICPEIDKDKFHYQVCFTTDEDEEFVLISYVGYKTAIEAEEAWGKEWLQVITYARNINQYNNNGKISLVEQYFDPESNTCETDTFIAVIPKKRKTKVQGQALIDFYIQLADLFPIYTVEIADENVVNVYYKYRVVVKEKEIIDDSECINKYEEALQGSLLWDSVDSFATIEEVIQAYQHFYVLAGTSNNCNVLCKNGKFFVGLIEVLAESACNFKSEAEAWDSAFPKKVDSCNDCIPGGLREFIYAAEDTKNYIPVCDQTYWKFKIVSPKYYVANHSCWYNTKGNRDTQITAWSSIFEGLDWKLFSTGLFFEANEDTPAGISAATHLVNPQKERFKSNCDVVDEIRKCIKIYDEQANGKNELKQCIIESVKGFQKRDELIKLFDTDIDAFYALINRFPIYKTAEGYCYRLYWSANDTMVSETGLLPCGCEEDTILKEDDTCKEVYPFVSENYYSCCSEALLEFEKFCQLIASKSYAIECVSKAKYGPYSFQIVDPSRELAYHPQQYNCLQEVEDAIEKTKTCVDNTGMHLLEHILLRPKHVGECSHSFVLGGDDVFQTKSCLLPICPDYCCEIPWKPDMDKNDPCIDNTDINTIYYLPGSDPYSFWATVALPAWVKRFRTKQSREAFEKLLYKEVPALVGLHILWLSPEGMCKFEDEYRRWLEWKQGPVKEGKEEGHQWCEPEKGPPICALVDCIKKLKSEPVCETSTEAKNECDCKSNEFENDDECCLPNDTKGTIFWSCCDTTIDLPQFDEAQRLLMSSVKEDSLAVLKTEETLGIEKKKVNGTSKNVSPKITKIIPKKVIKKKTEKAAKKEIKEHDLLALVRKRKPKYLKNIEVLSNEDMQKTKSYERTVFFLKNTPTLTAYIQLVNFFKRYSLQKDNNTTGFLGLLKNATWHLLDKLVINQKQEVAVGDIANLKPSLKVLNEKGLTGKIIYKEWNIEEVGQVAHKKALDQIKQLLNS